MKNVIELAKLSKEVYRATDELLQTVVRIKSKTKKAKNIQEIKNNVLVEDAKLENALDRINLAVEDLLNWGYSVVSPTE